MSARSRPDSAEGAEDDESQWRRGLFPPRKKTLLREVRAERTWTSRALHRLDEWTAHAWAGLIVAFAVLVWIGVGFAVGFPAWWHNALYSVSSSVTLIMVFALQHTQTRQQSATQRKLDELLRAQPQADVGLIAVEEAPDAELQALSDKNLKQRKRAVEQRDP